MAGLTVVLLPPSDALLGELDRRRLQSRESLASYRAAIPDMRRLVEAAVAGFRATGQAEAIRSASVDAGGHFSFQEVASGSWILIGQQAIHVDRTSSDQARESGTFLPQPRLVGYDRVLVWLRPVVVEPGRVERVELTDRNVWFEGVDEKTAARERTPNTGGRRRSAR
jgi:restriction endonuclease Mrr